MTTWGTLDVVGTPPILDGGSAAMTAWPITFDGGSITASTYGVVGGAPYSTIWTTLSQL